MKNIKKQISSMTKSESDNYMTSTVERSSTRIAVLFGGDSSEREISLLSGEAAAKALERLGFQVTRLDPANREDLATLVLEQFDLAFLVLHGKNGEDGAIQGMMEVLNIPYTGSGVWSSATAMNKSKAKNVYLAAGIPTPDSYTLCRSSITDADVSTPRFNLPCVVKALDGGSSIGVTIVRDQNDFAPAVEQAFKYADEALVEQYVEGREFTVPSVGNSRIVSLPAIELIAEGDLDFEAKYVTHDLTRLCPAPLAEDETSQLLELAARAHEALGCRGISRTDFLLDSHGTFWALETNTLPGMREGSFLEQSAQAAGIGFPELCLRLVDLALGNSY